MVYKSITPILMGLASLAGTVLADTKNIHGGFIGMCDRETVDICSSNAELDANQIFLCASCYDDNTKTLNKAVASKLDLGHCLTNFNGQLSWRNDGNFIKAGCENCSVYSVPGSGYEVNLQCDCNAVSSGVVIPIETSVINLNDGIHVHNGQLVCYEYEGGQVSAASIVTHRDAAPDYKNPVGNNPARKPGNINTHTRKRAADPDLYQNPTTSNPAFRPGTTRHTWKRDYQSPTKNNPAFNPKKNGYTWKKRAAEADPDYKNPTTTNPAFKPGTKGHTWRRGPARNWQ